MDTKFFKREETDNVWWVDNKSEGEIEFSFDRKHIYNLFRDYPYKLSKEEKEMFDEENPFWAHFFRGRK